MSSSIELSSALLRRLEVHPTPAAIVEISRAARDAKILASPHFKKLVAYLLDVVDGRDRRNPWTARPGAIRPVSKLRVAIDTCFGEYGDLHWFRLNKLANNSGQPLKGLFPRVAAGLGRVKPEHFGPVTAALLSKAPDAALLRILHRSGGRVPGMGLELFSRLAFTFRRDLFFTIPKPWGASSGCLKFIGGDLRRYCQLCRNLRNVCDQLGFPPEIRAAVLDDLLTRPKPPAALMEALHKAVGSTLSPFSALEADAAFEPVGEERDRIAMPVEFAAEAIRARRGRRDLRDRLCRAYGDRCAITGACVRDLLEVAYLSAYPAGDVHAHSNTLLLRADLHTLWDLQLIAVHPETRRVAIASRLAGTAYENLAGRELLDRQGGGRLNGDALQERWRAFIGAYPRAITGRDALPPPARTHHKEGFPGRDAARSSEDRVPSISIEASRGVLGRRPEESEADAS